MEEGGGWVGAGECAGEVGACEGLEVEASRIAFVVKLCLKIGRETAHEGTYERSGNEYTHLSNILALSEVQLEEVVFDLRPVGQSLVDRDRPRGGRPDHRMRADQLRDRAFDDLERHVDLSRGNVLIFDLGLGERGLFDRGPHHRDRKST